jgi:iron(III) transport system permease protein
MAVTTPLKSWPVIASAVVLLLPLISLPLIWFQPAGEVFWHLTSSRLPDYVWNTLAVSLLAGGLSVVMGGGAAFFVALYDFPARHIFYWLLALPLAIPSYLTAMLAFGFWQWSGVVATSVIFAFGLYPYVYLLTVRYLGRQAATLDETATMLGLSGFERWRLWHLPVSFPALITGLVLVMMEVLADYGTVEHMGVDTLTSGVYHAWFSLMDQGAAMRLAGMIVIFALMLAWMKRKSEQPLQYMQGDLRAYRRKPLSSVQGWVVCGALASLMILAIGLPVAGMITESVKALGLKDQLSLWQGVGVTTFQSLSVALAGAAITVSIAVMMQSVVRWSEQTNHTRAGLWMRCAMLGYAMPGAVIAVGVMMVLGWLADLTHLLWIGSLTGLIYGYVCRFVALPLGGIGARMDMIPVTVDVNARLLNSASYAHMFRAIWFPLLKPVLPVVWLIAMVEIMKELPATLILRPFYLDTLATKAYYYASDERLPEASLYALILVMVMLPMVWWLQRRVG